MKAKGLGTNADRANPQAGGEFLGCGVGDAQEAEYGGAQVVVTPHVVVINFDSHRLLHGVHEEIVCLIPFRVQVVLDGGGGHLLRPKLDHRIRIGLVGDPEQPVIGVLDARGLEDCQAEKQRLLVALIEHVQPGAVIHKLDSEAVGEHKLRRELLVDDPPDELPDTREFHHVCNPCEVPLNSRHVGKIDLHSAGDGQLGHEGKDNGDLAGEVEAFHANRHTGDRHGDVGCSVILDVCLQLHGVLC
mmetsp:Transcript_63357/g.113023  ORF Transcript_63357/g.113023 Transcript_63357/m.113023 type:complete len:245 (+) Transcript_63357:3151-3885(+)